MVTRSWRSSGSKFCRELPPKRGSDVSEYCVKLHERRQCTYLKDNNKPKDAALVEQYLAKVKTGK